MPEFDPLESPDNKYIHFIGIGGISMSGLAEILISLGYKVSGSDIRVSNITHKLEKLGVRIFPSHNENNIKGPELVKSPDFVVYTAAIKEDNPELVSAKALGIPTIDRASLLGNIMRKYKYGIAVSGTHGKTTTTSMIAMIMIESGLNPTVHVGGELDSIGGTTRIGGNEYFVTEACEYFESFLKFHPHIAVILNVEYDHSDYFRNIGHVKESFLKFASLVPRDGYVIACSDDPGASSLLDKITCNKITFGLKNDVSVQPGENSWGAGDIRFNDSGCASFTLLKSNEKLIRIELNVPGIHNVNNALAAIAVCNTLGGSMESAKQALKNFTGTRRRFELKGIYNDIKVVDDYAHHPSEIKATLKAAKNCCHSRIWCVFQPHTYSRTKSLLDEFAVSFADADIVLLADIYAAREPDTGEINSRILCEKIKSTGKSAFYIDGFEAIAEHLGKNAEPGDLIITMGAGDIYMVGDMLLGRTGVTR